MITVTELFARLSYGPLSNLAISAEGGGGIIASKQRSIIHYTNEALLRLHGKFVLIEKEMIVNMIDGRSSYLLTSEFAYTNQVGDSTIYIMDSNAVPYEEDLIKILQVFDGCGCPLPLNDEAACTSLFTPRPNLLQVPCPVDGCKVHIIYQARHVKLLTDPVDLAAEIHLPEVLEEALVAYIAHKVYSNMNGQEHAAKAAGHLANYEAVCKDSIERDLVNSSISQTNVKFSRRGFV